MSTVVDSAMTYGGNHLTVTLNSGASAISLDDFCNSFTRSCILDDCQSKFLNKPALKILFDCLCINDASLWGICFYSQSICFFSNKHRTLHRRCIATVASLTYIRNSVDPAVLGTAITLLNATLSIGKAIYGYILE